MHRWRSEVGIIFSSVRSWVLVCVFVCVFVNTVTLEPFQKFHEFFYGRIRKSWLHADAQRRVGGDITPYASLVF